MARLAVQEVQEALTEGLSRNSQVFRVTGVNDIDDTMALRIILQNNRGCKIIRDGCRGLVHLVPESLEVFLATQVPEDHLC